MADEYLDLVDENNKPTGKRELRSVAHSNGLWHRVVHIYIFRKLNSNFEFLVQLRSKNKDLHPNCWDAKFGGHVKSGETIENGVVNEIKEELDLNINFSKLIEGGWRKGGTFPNCEFSKTYFLEYNEPLENLSFNDGEVQEVKWLSAEEIPKWMEKDPKVWVGNKERFETILKFLITK